MATKTKVRPKSASLANRTSVYKDRYGGPCPYKQAPALSPPKQSVTESREYLGTFTRGLVSSTRYNEIILGPKRPSSGLRYRSDHKQRVVSAGRISNSHAGQVRSNGRDDELTEEDEKILSIRIALVKARNTHPQHSPSGDMREVDGRDLISKRDDLNLESAATLDYSFDTNDAGDVIVNGPGRTALPDTSTIKKLVPSYDTSYLRSRPPSQPAGNVSPSPPREGSAAVHNSPRRPVAAGGGKPPKAVHPELQRRSLFVCGLRDAVSTEQQPQQKTRPKSKAKKREVNSTQSDPPGRTRTRTALEKRSPSSRLDKAESLQLSVQEEKTSDRLKRQSSRHRSPTKPEEAEKKEEDEGFDVNTEVEARYRGRAQWLAGKIVLRRPDGSYDVQYGDTLERRVSASLIRHKSGIDVNKLKRKIKFSGYMAMAASDGLVLSGSFRRDEEQREADEKKRREESGEGNQPVAPTALPHAGRRNRSVIALHGPIKTMNLGDAEEDITELSPMASAPNRERKTLVRGTILQLAAAKQKEAVIDPPSTGDASSDIGSGSLPSAVPVRPPGGPFGGGGGGRPNFLGGLMGGMASLKKVSNPDDAKAAQKAKDEKERQEAEKIEQKRLWPEIQKIVVKERNEIAFEDLDIVSELGRGKFASVHKADLNVKVHSKVFNIKESAKRTFERLGSNLNKRTGENMVISTAIKVMEYKDAYPLVGGDWENDRPQEASYLDDTIYTDGENGDKYQESSRSRAATMNGSSYMDTYEIYPPSKCILEALREVRALVQLQHTNIVLLHGVVMKPRLILVMERMQFSLADALSTRPEDLQIALTAAQRIHVLNGVASGLSYMHTMKYIHRDLKVHNVLLTAGMGGFVAKLADFGTALRIPTNQLLTESVGTSGYTAPEVISGGYDLSADIFSLGILQWETLQPYDQKKENPLCGRPEEDAAEDIYNGVRPPLDHCLVPGVHELVRKCWETESKHRPTASEVLSTYQQLVVSGGSPDLD